MEIKKDVQIFILILFLIIIVLFFFIPELIHLYKIKQNFNQIELTLDNYENQKIELSRKLGESQNISEVLQQAKHEELKFLKNIININSLYEDSINEDKEESYLTDRKNDEMKGLIKLYEENIISSTNIINNLQNYFKSHTLDNYYNNISNILLISTIIKNQSDIDFIYNKIIQPFYSEDKDNNKKYIISSPCFKATIDSNDPYIFHKKCKNAKDTLMLIKTNKTRFGGITELSWGKVMTRQNEYVKTKTRLFNLDNQKICLYNKNQEVSRYIPPIRAENYYFAIFGYNDIYLGYLPWESNSAFPQQFLKNNDTNEDFNELLNQKIDNYSKNKKVSFEYLDIEVYPIIPVNDISENQ